MQVNIINPKGVIWQGMTRELTLPGADGEVCVLDFHQPFLIKLQKGYVRSALNKTFIKSGLASMHGNEVTVFAEQ